MQWRNIIAPALLAATLAFAGTATAAEYKVAFVEVARLLKEAPQVEAVRDKLKKEFARRDEELVAQQKQVKKLQDKLQRDGAIMSESESKRLERDIISRRQKIKSAQSEFQTDLSLRQNEELGKLRKVIAEIIVGLAKKQGFDMVLEGGVVWASDRANITDQVLDALRAQYKPGK